MFRSFLRLGFRNLFRKNRYYTLSNIAGLAIGLSSLWLVSLFIYDEYTFDRHYTNTDRIYRVVLDFTSDGNVTSWAKTSAPIGRFLQGAYPEVEKVTRIRKNPGTDLLAVGEKQFYEERMFFADSTFFEIFDIPFKQGNRLNALRDKHSVVITEELAIKYFGTPDVLGKSIRYDNQIDLKITGVMESMKPNSHFIADAFVTFSSLHDLFTEQRLNHWGQFDHYTYVLLQEGALPEQVESKLPRLIKDNAPEWVAEKEHLFLQPLASIHLGSDRKDEISPNSNRKYSYILGTIAIFILLMASANFINLSTANQLSRSKETAIQKALGASNRNLTAYFFTESSIVCFSALLISFAFTFIAIPYFNLSTGKEVSLQKDTWMLAPALLLTLVIILVTGYFSVNQTSNHIVSGIRKSLAVDGKSGIRSLLVGFQFTVSIFLIMATWIVIAQLNFLQAARFGFNSDNVIVIPIKDRSKNDRFKTISNEIVNLSGISKVSFSSSTPGVNNSLTYTYSIAGNTLGEQALATFLTDDSFFELYDIQLKEGRILNPFTKDTLSDVMLNEAAVRMFGLAHPIGSLVTGKVKGKVVGVVENFNHTSLHDKLQPVIFYHYQPTLRFVSIKLKHKAQGIDALARQWSQLYDGYPLEYDFLDDQIQRLYSSESKLSNAYGAFAFIAIAIAGIGLIGLTTYLLNFKLKEISIRKVFGSSNRQIVGWVYRGYIQIILISATVAGMAGYYFMERWLSGFSYHISLEWIYFIVPPFIMTAILFMATGMQSYYAARTNPIHYLRGE